MQKMDTVAPAGRSRRDFFTLGFFPKHVPLCIFAACTTAANVKAFPIPIPVSRDTPLSRVGSHEIAW